MHAQETGDDSETSTTISTWSHAQFEVVYRALSNLPITLSMLRAGFEALRFFGIPLQSAFQWTLSARAAGKLHILATHDIICRNNPDGIDMADSAKAMGLPYVRFHHKFSIGDISYTGGEDEGYGPELSQPVRLQPTWLSLGDYQNVAATMRLDTSEHYEPMTGGQLLDAGVMSAACVTEATGLEYAVGLPESCAPHSFDKRVGDINHEPLTGW